MKMRNILRWVHLLGAGAIGTYIYSPWSQSEGFTLLMQAGIIPVLTLTGLWMWKPTWFKRGQTKKGASYTEARRSSKVPAVGLVLFVAPLFGIHGSFAQQKLMGGSGGFMMGFKTQNTAAYQYFVREGGPQIGDHILQIGGEGYGLLNRWVIGGGGYYNHGDQSEDGNLEYQVHGGGGYVNLGYVVYNTDQLLVFPLLGVGADAVGINRGVNEDVVYEPGRFLEANYFTVTPTLDLGGAADWFPGKKGAKIGIRAGYVISLSRDNDWRHYGGDVTNPDLPNNDLDGFYIRLTVGGGHFKAKD